MADEQHSVLTCPVLIGREREMSAFHEQLSPLGRCVLMVSGDAGVGKSRLVAAGVAAATQFGYQVLKGACFEPDKTLPYAPLLDMLHSWFAGQQPEAIRHTLGAHAAVLAPLFPEMGWPAAAPSDARPEAARRRLFQALCQLFCDLSAHRPVLLVVDDLHWSDDATLAFLQFLARRIGSFPVRLVLTYRSDAVSPELLSFLAELSRERLAAELELTPLGRQETAQMLGVLFHRQRPVSSALLDAVFDLTEGNPFFIEEVAQSLVAGEGGPNGAGGGWDRKPLHELRIPVSVRDAVARRVAQLSPGAHSLLLLAAVVGRRFDIDLLLTLTQSTEAQVLGRIKELIEAQLVVEETPDRFAFRHALTHQAIYGKLLARERRSLHKTIAEAIEQANPEGNVEQLAYHYFNAEVWQKAMAYAARAAERAQRLYTPRAAVEHFSRALVAAGHLGSAPSLSWFRARGQAYETLGEFERALADYGRALELAQQAADRREEVEVLLALSLLWAGRDYARSGEHAQRALALAQEMNDDALLAHSLNRVGNWYLNTDQPVQALAYHQRSLSIFQQLNDEPGMAETLDLLGASSYFSADIEAGTLYYGRAIALLEELDDRVGLASSLAMLTMQAPTYQTDTMAAPAVPAAAAIAAGERALQTAREIGQRPAEAYALVMLTFCLGAQGQYRRALEMAESAVTIAESIDHRQWTAAAHCALGVVYLDLLNYERAREHLEIARTLAQEINSVCWMRRTSGFLASAYLHAGEPAQAGAVLQAALSADTPQQSCGQRLAWCARAELALESGEPGEALRIVEAVTTSGSAPGSQRPGVRLLSLRGQAQALLGGAAAEAAEATLLAACEAAANSGALPLLWRVRAALGVLYQTRGGKEAAQREFAEARTLIENLAADLPDPDVCGIFLEQALGQLPRRRSGSDPNGLTLREQEIAQLVAQGFSNARIAERLVLSDRTVETHISNALRKLSMQSRVQLAAWVAGRQQQASV